MKEVSIKDIQSFVKKLLFGKKKWKGYIRVGQFSFQKNITWTKMNGKGKQ
jgi:hypothetical protein